MSIVTANKVHQLFQKLLSKIQSCRIQTPDHYTDTAAHIVDPNSTRPADQTLSETRSSLGSGWVRVHVRGTWHGRDQTSSLVWSGWVVSKFHCTERVCLRPTDTVHTRHGTGSHFVTQRPGDPVDPVTPFYNELQMSTHVADKRLLRGKEVCQFYRCLAFARFWKVKF